jgi:ketosteroid isomerase-like protein
MSEEYIAARIQHYAEDTVIVHSVDVDTCGNEDYNCPHYALVAVTMQQV